MPFKQLIFRFLIKAVSVNNKRFDKPEKFTVKAANFLVLGKSSFQHGISTLVNRKNMPFKQGIFWF
jgi:hypothetical protein